MIKDIIGIKDAMNLNLISRIELKELSIDEQDILISIRDYQTQQEVYSLW